MDMNSAKKLLKFADFEKIKNAASIHNLYTKITIGLLEKDGQVIFEMNNKELDGRQFSKGQKEVSCDMDFEASLKNIDYSLKYNIKKNNYGLVSIFSPVKYKDKTIAILYLRNFFESNKDVKKSISGFNLSMEDLKYMSSLPVVKTKDCKKIIDTLGDYIRILFEKELNENMLLSTRKALDKTEELCRLAIEASDNVICDLDLNLLTITLSKDIYSIESGTTGIREFVMKSEKYIYHNDFNKIKKAFMECIYGKADTFKGEARVWGDGEYKWVMYKGKVLKDDKGRVRRLIGELSEITDLKKYEERIKHLAYDDPLTELPNRNYFFDKLKDMIKSNQKGAIIIISIDNIKIINDSLGRKFTDDLIRKIANRIFENRPKNVMFARLSGSKFVLVVKNEERDEELLKIAKDLSILLEESFDVFDNQIYITTHIGISKLVDSEDENEVVKNADIALNYARKLGVNNYKIFDMDLNDDIKRKAKLEFSLSNALQEKQFVIHYQPQLDIKSGKIDSVEALLRWNHPEEGVISPNDFIPIAEDTGLIVPIGEWVVEEVCRQIAEWRRQGVGIKRVAVNISVIQIYHHNFINNLINAINKYGIEPQWLELEITENIMLNNVSLAINKLKKLEEIGFKISLDDFGTGYSSLNYLKQLPIGTVKIDKSFIDGYMDTHDSLILKGIIQLAHALKLEVIAEGIEKDNQVHFLKNNGCDKIQGYYISKPLEAKELIKKIKFN